MRLQPFTAASRQRGAGVLAIVLMLGLLAGLASWYAVQAQHADTRAAAHQHRAAQALAAAESGVEWAVSMLGQGRIDGTCQASTDPAHASLRERVIRQGADLRLQPTGRRAACTMPDGVWRCACDDAGLAALADATSPGFVLAWSATGAADAPTTITLQSRGCTHASADCLAGLGRGANDEGAASVTVLLGQWSALASVPAAAVTAGGAVDPGDGDVVLDAHDASGPGVAIASGGTWVDRPTASVLGRAGSPREAAIAARQDHLASTPIFESLFGLDRATQRAQPALVRVACAADDCSHALGQAAAAHPGRILWVPGALRLRAPVTLGSPDRPVLLSIDGELQADAGFSLHGLVHLAGARATWSGGVARIHGALVAEQDLTLSGAVSVVYDLDVLQHLHLRQGSLVRAPGGWRDRPAL